MDTENLIQARDLPPLGGLTRMERPSGSGCGYESGDHNTSHGGCGGHGHADSVLPCTCGSTCGEVGWGLKDHPLAIVYSPCQAFCSLYDPETALGRGTLFSELDLPLGGVAASCRYPRY